jgi:RNA polymerase sigma factor for flagellar operon FliA
MKEIAVALHGHPAHRLISSPRLMDEACAVLARRDKEGRMAAATFVPRRPPAPTGEPDRPVIVEAPAEWWELFAANPTVETRNRIMMVYLSLVHAIAKRLARALPAQIDVEDLISAGCFGLIEAIGVFNPRRGIKFSTFASKRVFGAVIDHLRAMDWPTRTVRQREEALLRAIDSFIKDFGREPDREELIARLGGSRAQAERTIRDGRTTRMGSLSASRAGDRRPLTLSEVIADPRRTPGRAAADGDTRAFIARHLSRAEWLLVTLYYTEHMTMREIGIALGLSESRISQMRTLVLRRLRAQFDGRREELRAGR